MRGAREASRKLGNGVRINPELCFYNPDEVYRALTENRAVLKWLSYISSHYKPPRNRVLLIYPCSAEKPYHTSRSYKQLYSTLNKLAQLRNRVSLSTVSEPFGIIPEEFYGKKTRWHDWENDWYNCPGLFEWWCRKYGFPFSDERLEDSIDLLAWYVSRFLRNISDSHSYDHIIGFVRTYSSCLQERKDHTHRRILDRASRWAGTDLQILPPRQLVSSIVRNHGRLAWDLYGVSHPVAQEYLLRKLRPLVQN